MNNDLVSVKALPEFRLEVELVDGRRGVMDLKPHLGIPALSRHLEFLRDGGHPLPAPHSTPEVGEVAA